MGKRQVKYDSISEFDTMEQGGSSQLDISGDNASGVIREDKYSPCQWFHMYICRPVYYITVLISGYFSNYCTIETPLTMKVLVLFQTPTCTRSVLFVLVLTVYFVN